MKILSFESLMILYTYDLFFRIQSREHIDILDVLTQVITGTHQSLTRQLLAGMMLLKTCGRGKYRSSSRLSLVTSVTCVEAF